MNSKWHIFHTATCVSKWDIGPLLKASSDRFVFIFSIKNRLHRQQWRRFSFVITPSNWRQYCWREGHFRTTLKQTHGNVHHRHNGDISKTPIFIVLSMLWTWKDKNISRRALNHWSLISWLRGTSIKKARTSIICFTKLIMAHS